MKYLIVSDEDHKELMESLHPNLQLLELKRVTDILQKNLCNCVERKGVEEERTQLLVREQEARKQFEKAYQLKDEFLATISHELFTPLTPIVGWAEMLYRGEIDETKVSLAIETIWRNAMSLSRIVNDLLDMSKINTGNFRLYIGEVNLKHIIKNAINAISFAVDVKEIKLQIGFDPSAGPVLGDAKRLQQVVWNLLSNAVKFTPKGGSVGVRLERVDSQVEIRVSDTGKGISAEFLPHLFEHFSQADGSKTRRFGGLGLGLSLVRRLVELHGGTVHAESPGEGQGATFTVKLPLMAGRSDPE